MRLTIPELACVDIMNTQLTRSELNTFENILPPDGTAQDAIALLKDQNGDIEVNLRLT
ncbi:hypothetical protein [Coleofasciculus sp. E2-BRE-01]|uniref:hypothetical protein n=1 Tax=Coleofasciculus sp. E2-BRE-01 TaxID=3069524 RepID=UPI00406438CD